MSSPLALPAVSYSAVRLPDLTWGAGYYRAPRDDGEREHLGLDVSARPGMLVVTWIPWMTWQRNAYPYGPAAGLGGAALKDPEGNSWKAFYFHAVQYQAGQVLALGSVLGVVQTLQARYPGVDDHIHIQGRRPTGSPIDPTPYLVEVLA